jgi:two-component system, cell cycle response regulator
MSLRVLLADESDTIKKVFQLALQDFNAEVKGVHSGLDVIDVALSFKPDIIFADVLLQKKNGYDICLELKQHPLLNTIPVVLMWSSFMELDQNQFKRSLATDQLEKPFDADFLRDLVKKYVPAVSNNPMSSFLNFPKSISADIKEDIKKIKTALEENSHHEHSSEFNRVAVSEAAPPTDSLGTPSSSGAPKSLFDELKVKAATMNTEENAPAKESIHAPPPPPAKSPQFGASSSESWQSTDLSKFKLELGNDENLDKFESLNLSTSTTKAPPAKDADSFSQVSVSALDEVILDDEETQNTNLEAFQEISSGSARILGEEAADDAPRTVHGATSTTFSPASLTKTSAQTASEKRNTVHTSAPADSEIEAIVRAHTEEYIKTELKQSLFEMMEKIVREELNKVLEEEVGLKQELSSDQP